VNSKKNNTAMTSFGEDNMHPQQMLGKSSLLKLWKESDKVKPVKIIWHRLPGRKLKATWEVQPRGREWGLHEEDLLPIQEWVDANLKTSKRISFDTWLFKNEKHITMFLLMWA
jgi:hypothetical protein